MIKINADDFGLNSNINNSIRWCFEKKIINSTTLLVNTNYTNEAYELAITNNFLSNVGLHLNYIEGEPLLETTKNSIICTNNVFNGEILKKKYNFYINKKLKKIIYSETEAQIKKFFETGFTNLNIDSHQHVHTKYKIYKIIKPLLKKYNCKSVRLTRNITTKKTKIIVTLYKFIFNKIVLRKYSGGIKYFTDMITYESMKNKLKNKNIEIMVHPYYDNERKYIIDKTANNMGKLEAIYNE